MDSNPCHCNGSSGTDCYYCGGSGFKTLPIRLVTKQPKSYSENVQDKEENLDTYKGEKLYDYKPNIRKPTCQKRIHILNLRLQGISVNSNEQIILKLKHDIQQLESDIKKLKNRIQHKKHQEEFDDLVCNVTKLQAAWVNKYKPVSINNKSKNKKTQRRISTKNIHKNTRERTTYLPSFSDKFKSLFEAIKKSLK